MAIHKYIFWITESGIQTYRMAGNRTFELVPFHGEATYSGNNINDFAKWVNKMAAIADDDFIDFCYLSDSPISSQIFNHPTKEVSSWRKEDIILFCETHHDIGTCEVIIDDNTKYICQTENIYNKKGLKSIYLKCLPNFLFNIETDNYTSSTKPTSSHSIEETSLINRYFTDLLENI